ncbi:hypothetical protein Tco_0218597 [Tanacetum coccineum]
MAALPISSRTGHQRHSTPQQHHNKGRCGFKPHQKGWSVSSGYSEMVLFGGIAAGGAFGVGFAPRVRFGLVKTAEGCVGLVVSTTRVRWVGDAPVEGAFILFYIRHGLFVTIVCYVLLVIVVDRGTRSVPLFVVLKRDHLKTLMDSIDVIGEWMVCPKGSLSIVCHRRVLGYRWKSDEILHGGFGFHGERTQGVVKTLMNTKVEFRIDLVHGATSVAKSPYRLAPLEMQELSEQLRELQDNVLELLRKEKLYAKFTKSEAVKNLGSTYDTIRDMIILRKGRVKLRRVRAMSMTIQSSVKDKILATSSKTSKVENVPAEMLRDLDQQMEKRADDGKANMVTDALSRKEPVKLRRVRVMAMTIQYGVRGMILIAQSEAFKQENVPLVGSKMDEAHASRYLVHPGADKKYYNLGDILRYLSENEKESPWILSLNFQDQSNNSKEWNSGDDQLRLRWMIYLVVLADAAESVRDTIGFDYHSSIWCAPFEALYGRKCRSPILWAEIEESSLIGPELVQEATNKVVLIKEKLKVARDRQKSYADNRHKPLEFEVGDQVMLKVSPWKGVIRFGKKGKLAPRFDNQSIERDRLIGIGFVLDFVEFISFTFSDKEMILVIEAISR